MSYMWNIYQKWGKAFLSDFWAVKIAYLTRKWLSKWKYRMEILLSKSLTKHAFGSQNPYRTRIWQNYKTNMILIYHILVWAGVMVILNFVITLYHAGSIPIFNPFLTGCLLFGNLFFPNICPLLYVLVLALRPIPITIITV